MGILDIFTLVFKTDTKGAEAGMAMLEKKIDSLTAKGKKRTEQETRDLKEAKKQYKDLADSIKDAEKESDKLVDSLTNATAALVGFAAVRARLTADSKFNSDLTVQSRLLNQSARDLKVYGAAAEAAGGGAEGFQGTVSAWYKMAADAGIKPGKFGDWIKNVQGDLSKYGDDIDAKNQRIDSYGLPIDAGLRNMLLHPDEFAKQLKAAEGNVTATDKDIEAGRKTQEYLSHMSQSLDSILTKINSWLPTGVSGALQGAPGRIAEDVIGIALAGKALKLVRGSAGRVLGGAGEAVVGAGAAIGGGMAALVATAAAAVLLIVNHKGVADFLDNHGLNPFGESSGGGGSASRAPVSPAGNLARGLRNNNPGNLRQWAGAGSDGSFAVFPSAQAGLHAMSQNLRNYGRQGIDTIDGIINKWAPSSENDTNGYISAMEKMTGFKSGQHLDMNDPATLSKLMKGITQHENGSNPFSDSDLMNSIGAGKSIMAGMGSMMPSSGGKTTSVKIDKIEVNAPQATDAQGIAQGIGKQLSSVLKYLAADNDDGVKA